MSRFSPAKQERIDRLHARQHATHVLRHRIPGYLHTAVQSRDPVAIGNAVFRAGRDGIDLGDVVRGRLRGLMEARGKAAIDFAIQHLAEIAIAAFSFCKPIEGEERHA